MSVATGQVDRYSHVKHLAFGCCVDVPKTVRFFTHEMRSGVALTMPSRLRVGSESFNAVVLKEFIRAHESRSGECFPEFTILVPPKFGYALRFIGFIWKHSSSPLGDTVSKFIHYRDMQLFLS